MNPKDIQKALEAIGKSGIKVAGDLVIEKHVQYEVENVEDGGIGIQINNQEPQNSSKTPKSENSSSWEEAIPEYLRTGKLLVAWNKLRDAGLLDKDYHLAKNVSKAAANYIVMGFCDGKKKKEWKPFEEFWGLTNLKVAKGQFSKEQNETISQIFMNL